MTAIAQAILFPGEPAYKTVALATLAFAVLATIITVMAIVATTVSDYEATERQECEIRVAQLDVMTAVNEEEQETDGLQKLRNHILTLEEENDCFVDYLREQKVPKEEYDGMVACLNCEQLYLLLSEHRDMMAEHVRLRNWFHKRCSKREACLKLADLAAKLKTFSQQRAPFNLDAVKNPRSDS